MDTDNLIIQIGVDAAKAHSELPKVRDEIKDVGDAAKDADEKGSGLGGMMDVLGTGAKIAGAGALALGGFLVGAAKAANDEQVGMDRLYTSLQANIPQWNGNTNAVEAYVSKTEGMAFADDKIRDSLSALVTRTHDLSEAQTLQAEAMDLARGKNLDLQTATEIIGKVYDGNTGILARYGIQVDKGATSTEALAAIQKTYAGQAEKYAGSAAGSLDRLQTAMGDALETVGHSVLDLVAGPLQNMADWFTSPDVQQGIQTIADAVGTGLTNAFQFVSSAVQAAMPTIQGIFNFFKDTALPAAIGIFKFLQDNAVPVLIVLGSIILSQIVPSFIAWGTTMLTTTLPALWATVSATIAAAAPFVLVGAAVAGLYLAFQNNFLGIGDMVRSVWGVVQPILQPFINTFKTFFDTVTSGGDIMGALGTLFSGLGDDIAKVGPMIGPTLAKIGELLWKWVQDAAPQVWAALSGLVGGIASFIGTNVAPIVGALASWALAFAGWVLGTALPGLLGALGSLIGSLWNWIVSAAPGILAQLQTWGQQFWAWIVAVTPIVLANLGTLITNIWTWITTNGPTILQKLADWGLAFVNWVGPMIPPLLGALGNALLQLGGWIVTTALPAIVGKLVEWAGAFIGWVAPMIPPLLGKLLEMLGSLTNWLATVALPAIITKLGEWAGAFLNWIANDVLPQLPGKLEEMATAIWNWFTATSTTIGTKLVSEWVPAIWTWITGPGGVLAGIGEKLGQIAQKIWDWITATATTAATNVLTIGSNIVSGIQTGISNGWQAFVNWVLGLLGGLLDAVKAFFGIKSPSTVFADGIGAPMVLGIKAGWDAQMPALNAHMQNTLGALTSGLQSRVDIGLNGSGGGGGGGRGSAGGGLSRGGGTSFGTINPGGGGGTVNVTIPIHVDGNLIDTQQLSIDLQGRAELTTPRGRL